MDSQTPGTSTQAGLSVGATVSDHADTPSNSGLHTVEVKFDNGNPMYKSHIDPIFIIKYPSFQLMPLVTTSETSSGPIAYTLVGDVSELKEPDMEPGSTRNASDFSKRPRKRMKRNIEYFRTSLQRTINRGSDNSIGLDSDEEEEVIILSCEWDECEEDFTELKMLMAHVRDHIENELPVVSQEDDDRLNEDGYGCLWQDCLFVSVSLDEVVRHVHFHTFHTHVKSIGADIVRKTEINHCQLDTTQRNIVPELSEPFRCLWQGCKSFDSDFPEAIKFYWHVLWHTDDPRDGRTKEISCLWRGCSTKTKNLAKLKDHLRSHSQERVVGCPVCGGLFSNRSKFFDHCKRQAPPEELNFKCSYCNKFFALERLLRDHMRQHINHYKCSECEMTSPTPSALAAHVAYRHSTEKNFPCSESGCSYRAKTSHDLLSHLRATHLGENEFKCSIDGCFFRCKAKMTLKHHVEVNHKESPSFYCCHLCTKRFKRGNYLTKHLLAQHKFRWPSGHSRFRYKQDDEGLFHLQTIRFESSDLGSHVVGSGLQADEDDPGSEDENLDSDLDSDPQNLGSIKNDPDDEMSENPNSLFIVVEDD